MKPEARARVLIDFVLGMVKRYTQTHLSDKMYIFLEFPLSVSDEPVEILDDKQVTIITGQSDYVVVTALKDQDDQIGETKCCLFSIHLNLLLIRSQGNVVSAESQWLD